MTKSSTMTSRTKKTVLVYIMLIMSTIPTEGHGQLTSGFVSPVGQSSKSFTSTNTVSSFGTNSWPAPIHSVNSHPAAKGFFPTSGLSGYNQYPLNTHYWTGHSGQFMPHHQYPYNQYAYNNWQHPQQYGYYPQPYGYHQQSGYNNQYGHYPNFDAGYWMGHQNYQNYHHPGAMTPMYMPHHQTYMPHPAYHHPQMVYHRPVFYQGHWISQPMYAYPSHHYNQFDRGFLGGTGGQLAKGLLGAVLVGAIAGNVARRG